MFTIETFQKVISNPSERRDLLEFPGKAHQINANPDSHPHQRHDLAGLVIRLPSDNSKCRIQCEEISDENALRQAQDILVRCGAVSYCVDLLLRRYQSACEILQTIQLARPDSIESLLEEVIAPVRRLFEAVGESLTASAMRREAGNGA